MGKAAVHGTISIETLNRIARATHLIEKEKGEDCRADEEVVAVWT